MSTDDERLREVERDLARHEERISSTYSELKLVREIDRAQTRTDARLDGIQAGLNETRVEFDILERKHDEHVEHVTSELAKRDEREAERARETRRYRQTAVISLVGLAIMFAGLIVTIVTVIGGH